MPTVDDIAALLDDLFPPALAEEWDNVGLLVGDRRASVERLMTCLTLTPDSVDEAVARRVSLVVSHHPLPFKPLKRLTTDTVEGALLWRLAGAGVAVYSPHTAFDSAEHGINRRLADALGLRVVGPLLPKPDSPEVGAGRVADAASGATADGLAATAKSALGLASVRIVARADQPITRIGLACGSGASLLDAAIASGCDALFTGEATFHSCLAAEAQGVALLLLGHYASERFAVEALAEQLASELTSAEVWACGAEHDPLRTV
ncbi:MAG: Nif3-like dinuclear metal center hexameric protein [Planctomycetota bacterium]